MYIENSNSPSPSPKMRVSYPLLIFFPLTALIFCVFHPLWRKAVISALVVIFLINLIVVLIKYAYASIQLKQTESDDPSEHTNENRIENRDTRNKSLVEKETKASPPRYKKSGEEDEETIKEKIHANPGDLNDILNKINDKDIIENIIIEFGKDINMNIEKLNAKVKNVIKEKPGIISIYLTHNPDDLEHLTHNLNDPESLDYVICTESFLTRLMRLNHLILTEKTADIICSKVDQNKLTAEGKVHFNVFQAHRQKK